MVEGLNQAVHAIIVDQDLGLISYLGGDFTLPMPWLMRWTNDEGWIGFSDGLMGPVKHLEENNIGVFTAGDFGGNVATYNLNTHRWEVLSGGLNGRVNALETYGGNLDKLIVGGEFTNAGGIGSADMVVLWDGLIWQSMGTVPHIDVVSNLLTHGSDL